MWVVYLHQGLLLLCASTSIVFTPASAGKYARGRSYCDDLTFAEWPIADKVRRTSLLNKTLRYSIKAFNRGYVTHGFIASVISSPASPRRRPGCKINSALFRLQRNLKSLSRQLPANQSLLYQNNGSHDPSPGGRKAIKTRRSSGEGSFFRRAPALQAATAAAVEEHPYSKSAKKEDGSKGCISGSARVISITTKARDRLRELRERQNSSEEKQKQKAGLYLRLGVQSGGCSGLSYVLNIIDKAAVASTDFKEEFEDEGGGVKDRITVVVDPKSLLYVVGTVLDYNDDLIGGGFKVSNPNATRSCGCGMSFGVPKTFAQHLIDSKPTSCSAKNTDKSVSAPRETPRAIPVETRMPQD